MQALRLPHYVFDGQIGQKLPEFDEELLGYSRGEVPDYLEGHDPVRFPCVVHALAVFRTIYYECSVFFTGNRPK